MNEFFGTLKASAGQPRIPADDLDGREFWRFLATPVGLLDAIVRDGLRPAEMCYPYEDGQFSPATGVPAICHFVLPMLTSDPDGLFGRLSAEVPTWPRRTAAAQYLALFEFLAGLLGRRVTVERTAATLVHVPALHEQFPDARFVHLHRDGPDCALSMSRHPVFRRELLAVAAVRAAGRRPGATLEDIDASLPAHLRGLISPPFDAGKLMSHPIPVELFGQHWWSDVVRCGVAALAELPTGTWTSVGYEALLRDPRPELTRLAQFLGVRSPEGWLGTAQRMIDPTRTGSAAAQLDPAALTQLRAVCEPGMRALAAAQAV